MAKGGGGGGGITVFGHGLEKPKSFLDAIEDIEQYGDHTKTDTVNLVRETYISVKRQWQRRDADISADPGQFKLDFESQLRKTMEAESDNVSSKARLEFFEVGFKGSLLSGLVTAMLTPLAVGVIEEHIPVFGDIAPTPFDKAFVFMLALGFNIGYALFISRVAKYHYLGVYTRPMVRNFYSGVLVGAGLKAFLSFIFFHFLYLKILKDKYIIQLVLACRSFLSEEKAIIMYEFIRDFKPVFLTSAYVVLFTTALFVAIPIASVIMAKKKAMTELIDSAQIIDIKYS